MSLFTEGDRGDLATSRTLIIDHSSKDNNGKKRFRVLPWTIVEYAAGIGGIEPTTALPATGVVASKDYGVSNPDRHPTDILFYTDSTFYIRDNGIAISGGDVGFPVR